MRVAIVGSRDYLHRDLVELFVTRLAARVPDAVVISGGARGVDAWAAAKARQLGLQVWVYEADWDQHGRQAGILRNSHIVARADAIVAFWNESSRGTLDTIRKGLLYGRRVQVIGKDRQAVPVENLRR